MDRKGHHAITNLSMHVVWVMAEGNNYRVLPLKGNWNILEGNDELANIFNQNYLFE